MKANRIVLPATLSPNSPIHHARSRTTAHLQRTRPTKEADYKRNLLQHQIHGHAEEQRLRKDAEQARQLREKLAKAEAALPEGMQSMDKVIERFIVIVDDVLARHGARQ